MYLYIGQDTVLREDEVVGLFDLDNTTWSKISQEFLSAAEQENRVFQIGEDVPRSFVLCSDGQVYLTQLTTSTLKQRGSFENPTQM